MNQPSLFRPDGRAALLARLRALRPDTRPEWGRMDAAQMLAHCAVPLRVALGELPLGRSLVGRLFGRMAWRKLSGPQPFDRNLPTAPEFRVGDARDFAREREALVVLVERFAAQGAAGRLVEQHPFFGRLAPADWDLLMAKHLDHHLRQFGAG